MLSATVIFPWNSNFETGIALIDEQHRRLVDLLNDLAAHLAYGAATPGLAEVFSELSDYTQYHFETEEAIWKKYLACDEAFAEHQKNHRDFVSEMMRIKGEQAALENEEVIDEVVSFLTHWLAFHILESDKHMAKIVLALEQGMTLSEAKDKAVGEMSGAMRVLIETVLGMYDSLSSRTLQLMREVAERQRAEEGLRLSRSVIDSTLEAIFITDADGLIVDTNPAFCFDLQCTHQELLARNIREVKPGIFGQKKMDEIWQIASVSGHWAGEITGRDASGRIEAVWLALSAVRSESGANTHYVGLMSSVSQLMQRHHSLEDAVHHDALTGLPNRRLLNDRLSQAMMRSRRNKKQLAVCFLDLDGFKQVNDTLGHDAGDEVLCIVAGRLNQLLRGNDTVARMGGDEFVLLLGDLESEADAARLLDRVLSDIALPIPIRGEQVFVSASIGVSFYPKNQGESGQLLKHADEAMFVAKNAGKSRYHFYG